ncbi:MAG: Hsp20/alpha crystallin family protein [Gammaproteobacteria bacterium]|jgi:HSP20 family protein|nr:Hsp20/alpha crystallin family protein [Gammaproteobacteria bacterium]
MSLIVRDPWQMLDQWRKEMDQVLGGHPMARDDATRVVGSDWMPAVDIKEEQDRFVLHADIPGVRPEDIEVSMDNGVLTIRGERRHESQESTEGYKRLERQHGVFIRRFALPDSVDPERIAATGNNGVLEVSLPKAEKQQPRKIQVKA